MEQQVLDQLRQPASDIDPRSTFTNLRRRKTDRFNDAIVADDLTRDFAVAGVLLIIESLEKNSEELFEFSKSLTRRTVINKTHEFNKKASEGSFRSRWEFLPDYVADVVQYGLHFSVITAGISPTSFAAHESLSVSVDALSVRVSSFVRDNLGRVRLRLLFEGLSGKSDYLSCALRECLDRERRELQSSLNAMLLHHGRRPRSSEDMQLLVETAHAVLLGAVMTSGASPVDTDISPASLLKATLMPMMEHLTVAFDSSLSADGTWFGLEESSVVTHAAVVELHVSEQFAGPS